MNPGPSNNFSFKFKNNPVNSGVKTPNSLAVFDIIDRDYTNETVATVLGWHRY